MTTEAFDADFVFGGLGAVLDANAWADLEEKEPELASELKISVLRNGTPDRLVTYLTRRGVPDKLINWLSQAANHLVRTNPKG